MPEAFTYYDRKMRLQRAFPSLEAFQLKIYVA